MTYFPATSVCRLSGDDNLSAGPTAVATRRGANYYQKAPCVDCKWYYFLTQSSSDKVKRRAQTGPNLRYSFIKKRPKQDFVTSTLVSLLQRGTDTKLHIPLGTIHKRHVSPNFRFWGYPPSPCLLKSTSERLLFGHFLYPPGPLPPPLGRRLLWMIP